VRRARRGLRARGRILAPLVALLAGGGLSACASSNSYTIAQPVCPAGNDGTASNAVVLMAQAVPTATWVPCLRTALPQGWEFRELDARTGVARFWLDNKLAGDNPIQVRLERSCDTLGATEIPSDRDGMHRFERVTMTTPGFEGSRYYRFDGGCITFDFMLDDGGENRAEALALATDSVGAISRKDLQAQVHAESGGRLELDPPRGSR
jgi:hypothetical protein